MADYRERLAQRVRHEREREQLSRDELALKAGLNAKTIERIEEQKVENPRGNTIRSLAAAFGVDAEELNPPVELEEERLQRLEEKVDEILARLRFQQAEQLSKSAAGRLRKELQQSLEGPNERIREGSDN